MCVLTPASPTLLSAWVLIRDFHSFFARRVWMSGYSTERLMSPPMLIGRPNIWQ